MRMEKTEDCARCGGCGHCKGCGCAGRALSEGAAAFLSVLSQTPFLPVARYIAEDGSGHPVTLQPAPVYASGEGDTVESVRRTADALNELEARGLVSIDYDIPLKGAEEGDFAPVWLNAHFGRGARLQVGSVALTGAGQEKLWEVEL